jgi:hypothetical protein
MCTSKERQDLECGLPFNFRALKELHKLYPPPNLNLIVKARMIRCTENVVLGENKNEYEILV